ncbi:MAG: type II toxin-antitoxin system VapC family toxin [Acidimicrobiales bacterium]
MRILLDTHAWLWMLGAPERLGPRASAAVIDPANRLFLSAASSWEIAIKYRLGRLALPSAPEDYVPERLRRTGVEGLPVQHRHALAVASLELHHRDPFDRLLVAQARGEDMPILTADSAFDDYEVEVLAAGQ